MILFVIALVASYTISAPWKPATLLSQSSTVSMMCANCKLSQDLLAVKSHRVWFPKPLSHPAFDVLQSMFPLTSSCHLLLTACPLTRKCNMFQMALLFHLNGSGTMPDGRHAMMLHSWTSMEAPRFGSCTISLWRRSSLIIGSKRGRLRAGEARRKTILPMRTLITVILKVSKRRGRWPSRGQDLLIYTWLFCNLCTLHRWFINVNLNSRPKKQPRSPSQFHMCQLAVAKQKGVSLYVGVQWLLSLLMEDSQLSA